MVLYSCSNEAIPFSCFEFSNFSNFLQSSYSTCHARDTLCEPRIHDGVEKGGETLLVFWIFFESELSKMNFQIFNKNDNFLFLLMLIEVVVDS